METLTNVSFFFIRDRIGPLFAFIFHYQIFRNYEIFASLFWKDSAFPSKFSKEKIDDSLSSDIQFGFEKVWLVARNNTNLALINVINLNILDFLHFNAFLFHF